MVKPMNDGIDALVFDCDGTLVDTMPAHYEAWLEVLAPLAIPFPVERFYGLGGMSTRSIVAMLVRESGLDLDVEAIAADKEAASERWLRSPGPVPEVVAIAEAAKGHLPMAVATGSTRALAERALAGIGILPWFQTLVTAEDVSSPKPDPETYLLAAERLGVSPTRCRAFEDTDLGLESARAAGMHVVDIRLLRTDVPGRYSR